MLPLALVWLAAPLLSLHPLTTAQAVRELPHDLAAPRPVRLAGTVTYYDPDRRHLFLQDDTAGVFVMLRRPVHGLAAGDRAEVDGESNPGRFAPCVAAREVRRAGAGRPPEPLPYTLAREDSRWLDAQWVSAAGRMEANGRLRAADGTATLSVPGPGAADRLNALAGKWVRLRGVCVPTFDPVTRAVSGPPRLFVPAWDSVRVLPDPPDSAEPRLAEYLNRFVPSSHPGGRRVRVAGTVVGVYDPVTVFVQDATGGVCVRTAAPHGAAVGDAVEAAGQLQFVGPRPLLADARVAVADRAALPPPVARTAIQLAAGLHFGTLVEMNAEVIDEPAGTAVATLRQGDRRFLLMLPAGSDPAAVPDLRPGDRVRVVGVAGIHRDRADGGDGFLLLARSADDIVRLPRPAAGWLTPDRAAAAVGGLAAVGAVGFAWVGLLRRQVRRRTAEVRRSYERAAALEDQLRQAAKLEAVGRLAGGVAHDFNNLLTVINGCTEMAAGLLPDDHPARRLTADVLRAGERAADLTRQLLLFGRPRTDAVLLPLDLSLVAADAVRLAARLVGDRVRVEARLADGLPAVRADPGLVSQIILNLAVNARDAMPDGGTMTVATERTPAGGVRLTAADTGVGMPAEVQARIFEPFYTTKPVGQGTGLGLATVYGIVKTLGGSIGVESAVGVGTTFVIELPPADAAPPGTPGG